MRHLAADRPGPAEQRRRRAPDSRPAARGGCGWRRSGPASSASGGTTVRPMPSASARAARNAGVAAAAVAEGEIRPAGQVRARRARACSTSATNASAGIRLNARVERQLVERCARPAPPAPRRARPSSVSRNGGSSGRNSSRGCGSKVSTASGASGRAAWAARSTAAWPRCTPSKLPSATLAPRAPAGRSRQSVEMCMAVVVREARGRINRPVAPRQAASSCRNRRWPRADSPRSSPAPDSRAAFVERPCLEAECVHQRAHAAARQRLGLGALHERRSQMLAAHRLRDEQKVGVQPSIHRAAPQAAEDFQQRSSGVQDRLAASAGRFSPRGPLGISGSFQLSPRGGGASCIRGFIALFKYAKEPLVFRNVCGRLGARVQRSASGAS